MTTPPDGVAAGIVAGIRSDCAQILSPRSSRGLGIDSLNAFLFAFTSVLILDCILVSSRDNQPFEILE